MFESVRLVNRDDHFVADVHIPTFNPPVDVVLCEGKIFAFRDDQNGFRVYQEAILWSVIEQHIIDKRKL